MGYSNTVAFYFTKNEAEDLVQETYLRAFRHFDTFEPGTNWKAWLLTILLTLSINRYRQKRREPEMVDWEKIDQAYDLIPTGLIPRSSLRRDSGVGWVER